MMQRIFMGLSMVCLLTTAGCGIRFNPKTEVKGKLAKPLSQKDENELEALPDMPASKLKPDEQEKLASIVFAHLSQEFDPQKTAKMACHYRGLHSGAKCLKKRTECLEQIKSLSDDAIRQKIKDDEAKIKKFVKEQGATPKTFGQTFKIFAEGMDKAAELDCDSTEEQRKQAEDSFVAYITKEYPNNHAYIKYLLEQLLEYIFSFPTE